MSEELGPHDEVALGLQALRKEAGEPSYADIARDVAELRRARGVATEAATPPRSTVYDAFRLGRRRLDRELVADIQNSLERRARAFAGGPEVFAGGPDPETAAGGEAREGVEDRPAPALVETDDTQPAAAASPAEETAPVEETAPGPGPGATAVIVAFCLGINLVGLTMVDGLSIPIWLDMIGTAVAAIALGPWYGAGVGALSSVLDGALTGSVAYWFAPVQVAGALAWGYGARRFALACTSLRFFGLNALVAVVCTAVAAPIVAIKFGGYTQHESDAVSQLLNDSIGWLWLAILLSNLLFSMLDKLVSGFVALAVLEVMGARWHAIRRLLTRHPAPRSQPSTRARSRARSSAT